ncbi:MAG: hypothetical protein BGO67_04770 [Alphaproteobacteria bacterium 41-28]|nr:MAG: hypothetical protein BGO67_04770 [Alphaproteobacteria bacterium 41-28]
MKSLEFFKPNKNSKIRLFCFHHGGGSASTFYPWVTLLPVEVVAIQLPGRETRYKEPLLESMKEVVPHILEDFKKYTEKPFVIFGHSVGALIGFELVRSLRRLRLSLPLHLVMSGCKAPHLPLGRRSLHDLPTPKLISELTIYNGIPSEILNGDPELLDLFFPIIRADFKIGAMVFGHIGDRYGRKKALLLSISLMSLSTIAIVSTVTTKAP